MQIVQNNEKNWNPLKTHKKCVEYRLLNHSSKIGENKQTNNLQLTEVWLNEGGLTKTGVDDVEGKCNEKLPLIGWDVTEGTTVVTT